MDLQPFDLLFYKGTTKVSFLIRKITKSEYSHVALLLDEMHVAEIDWYYKLKIRHLEYDSDKFDVYRLKVGLTDIQRRRAMRYIYSHLQTKYDYKELLSILFKIVFRIKLRNDKHKLVCSSFVNEAFKACGVELKKGKLASPQDLISNKLYKITK